MHLGNTLPINIHVIITSLVIIFYVQVEILFLVNILLYKCWFYVLDNWTVIMDPIKLLGNIAILWIEFCTFSMYDSDCIWDTICYTASVKYSICLDTWILRLFPNLPFCDSHCQFQLSSQKTHPGDNLKLRLWVVPWRDGRDFNPTDIAVLSLVHNWVDIQ